ncbi:MAG TPA: hypothetical protein EYN91_26245 [Candidatus Melainabacteria bacterium]|nr:hypothetical protein [Candidatus Melainabacteria bacterium]
MEFTGFPRHQLRAMGRSKGRFSSRQPQNLSNSASHSGSRASVTKPGGMGHVGKRVRLAQAPECTEPSVLLEYLSAAANDLGREVIEPERLPTFATNTMPVVIVPPQRPQTVADEWSTNFSPQPKTQAPVQNRNFGLAESALQGLADLLTLEAGSIPEKASNSCAVQEFVQCARPPVDLVPTHSSSYELLNSWLNTGRSEYATTGDDEDDMIAYSLDEIQTVALYANESEDESAGRLSTNDSPLAIATQRLLGNLTSAVQHAETAEQLLASAHTNVYPPETAPVKTETVPQPATQPQETKYLADTRPALSRSTSEETPTLQMLPAGRRLETLENGAKIIKDSLGRVIEVRSPLGPVLRTRYDEQGHLRFFVRTDTAGNIQSYGESDKQGVVVHDPEGRVRAAGESMAIDRVGRLSIVRKDGQFWSIDLARGLHVERRQMVDEDGQWKAITAVFAYDGFRMVTRFQSMDGREFDEESGCFRPTIGAVIREEIRLYGRDGSCVQFDSEDAIEELRPSRVWPPASRAVDKKYRNRWQAGTAWQAVREYLELLKSGSG